MGRKRSFQEPGTGNRNWRFTVKSFQQTLLFVSIHDDLQRSRTAYPRPAGRRTGEADTVPRPAMALHVLNNLLAFPLRM